jgi:PfaB family protein
VSSTGNHPILKLAIIGMDACFGPWQSLDAYAQAIFQGEQAFSLDPHTGRWMPTTAPVEIDLADLGLSPDEFDRLTPAQLLGLKIANQALQNAGLSPDFDLPRLGVIAAGSPFDVDQAQRIAAHWDLSGLATTLEERAEWISSALDLAESWFETGQVAAVLLLGVNIAPQSAAQASAAAVSGAAGRPSLGFEADAGDPLPSSGAAAVLLKPWAQAQESGDRVFAVLEGWGSADPAGLSNGHFSPAQAIRSAYAAAGRTPAEAQLLETDARRGSQAEQSAILEVFRSNPTPAACALVGAAANLGDAGPVAGLAGLIRAALAVYHRLIPAIPGWTAPAEPQSWQSSPFYFPTESRPWFIGPDQKERLAGLNLIGADGRFTHLVLSRAEDLGQRANPFLGMAPTRLFPVGGSSQEDLLGGLDRLQSSLDAGQPIDMVSRQAYQRYSEGSPSPLALALIAGSPEELTREIEFARKGLPKAYERGAEWQTPLGSYFSPTPVGETGGVSFVYPGAFNSFIGLGKDLLPLFPAIYPRIAHLTHDIGQVLRERSLYPRTQQALSQKELDDRETALSQDPIAMLTSGSCLAVLYTQVLRYVFGVHPMSAFGYSLGETSMLYSLEIWMDGDAGNQRLSGSPMFQRRLSGPKETVREAWNLPPAAPGAEAEPLWSNLLLMANPEDVRQAMAGEPHVYLTHINTPRQVVIAGEPAAVRRVAAKIGCPALQAPFDHVLHCDPVRRDFDALAELHDFPVQPNPETALYTAAGYTTIRVDQKEIAGDIAETLCSCLDFPRLVNRVYADGARIFIEAGAGSNCSRWVDEILKGSPHLSISVSRKGSDDLSALLRTLARLVSHRASLDLSPLFTDPLQDPSPQSLVRTIHLA